MAAAGIGLMIAGTTLSAIGQIRAAQARADGMRRQSDAKTIQANEILRRGMVNVGFAEQELVDLTDAQISAFAGTGFGVGTSELQFMEETARRAGEEIDQIKLDAEKRAELVFFEGENLVSQAGAVEEAGFFSAAGTLLGGAAKFSGVLTGGGGS